jgi:tetratricopeptide (TPR) repeat protein
VKPEPRKKTIDAILAERPNYAPARLLKAELLVSQRRYRDALPVLEALIAEEPDSARAHYFKALAHLGMGERKLARSALKKSIELAPRQPRPRLMMAEMNLAERDLDGAEREAREVLAVQAGNYRATLILGNVALIRKDTAAAEKHYEALIQNDPRNPEGHFRMGLLRNVAGDSQAALNHFDQALALDPAMLEAFRQSARILGRQKRFGDIVARCDGHMAEVGDNPRAKAVLQSLKGDALQAMGRYDEAETLYRQAMAADSDFMPPYYALAGMHMRRNQTEKAIAQYEAALAQNPKQPGLHTILATIYDQLSKTDMSEKHYRMALEIDPEFAPAANNLAYLLAQKNQHLDEALNYARIAKEKFPDDPAVMDTMGFVYLRKGLIDSAILELEGSAAKLENNPTVRYHLGLAYHLKGEPQKARAELQAALSSGQAFAEKAAAEKLLSEI